MIVMLAQDTLPLLTQLTLDQLPPERTVILLVPLFHPLVGIMFPHTLGALIEVILLATTLLMKGVTMILMLEQV